MASQPIEITRTYCRVCMVNCGLAMKAQGETILKVKGDFSHPLPKANLGKPKPLVLSSRRQHRKFNAQLSFLGEPADILLHPDTAAERGIGDGRKVRVSTKASEIFLTAKIDPTMRKGVASIPHGHEHANVNYLTSTADFDPLGGMVLYSGVPIGIEAA